MASLGPTQTLCFVCRGRLVGEFTECQCSACSAVMHETCLHWSGSVTPTPGLGGEETLEVRCPSCGHVGHL